MIVRVCQLIYCFMRSNRILSILLLVSVLLVFSAATTVLTSFTQDYQAEGSYVPPTIPIGPSRIYLSGSYDLEVVSFNRATFKATFNNNNLLIEGCNSFSFPYEAYTNGSIIFKQGLSTLRYCIVDWDSEFVNALKLASSFIGDGIFYTLYSTGLIPTKTAVIRLVRTDQNQYSFPANQTYTLKSNSFTNITVNLDFVNQQFVVEGCNIHRLPYRAYSNGYLNILEGSSTRRTCVLDFDNEFISQLLTVQAFTAIRNGFYFYFTENTSGTPDLEAAAQINVDPAPPSVSLAGQYTLSATGLVLRIQDGSFSLSGNCNSFGFSYESYGGLKATGYQIHFGEVISTLRYCQNDYDRIYVNAILASTHYQIDDTQNLIKFYDDKQDRTVDLKIWLNNKPSYGRIDGSYKVTLAKNFIDLSINEESISISGCNIHTFGYKADQNGVITFSDNIISTERACLVNDFDLVFVQSVYQATHFSRDQEYSIHFLQGEEDNQKELSLAKVERVDGPINNKPTTLRAGSYKLNILNSNLPQVSSTISADSIGFSGCNIVSMPYEAYLDGSIVVKQGISTKKYCTNDKDSFYINSLLASVDYVYNDAGRYIFYNEKNKAILEFVPVSNN